MPDTLYEVLGLELGDLTVDGIFNHRRATVGADPASAAVEKFQRGVIALPKDRQVQEFLALATALRTQKNAYGVYGPTTKAAVRKFNQLYGRDADGDRITDATLAALAQLSAPGEPPAAAADAVLPRLPLVDQEPAAASPGGQSPPIAPSAPVGSRLGEILTRRYAGLPVYGWGAIGLGALVAIGVTVRIAVGPRR